MRRTLLAAVLSLVFALSMLGGASAATNDTVGGNSVTNRSHVDDRTNFYLVDRNNPFDADGTVDEWEIYAENTNQVALVIYRNSGGWSEVGRSGVKTPVEGYNRFTDFSISVQDGDYVGLYYPGAGSVSYSLDGASTRGDLNEVVLFTNSGGGTTAFVDSSDRVYSVRASGPGVDEEDNNDDDDNGSGDGQDRVGVCHATGNGSVFIEVSEMGWENGHEKHGDSLADNASDCESSNSASDRGRQGRGHGRNS